MPKSLLFALLGAAASALLIASISWLADDLFVTESYWTCEEARAEDFFKRGWMPDVLPKSCGPVASAQDLDINSVCASATMPAGEVQFVQDSLMELGFGKLAGALDELPFRDRCPFSLDDISTTDLKFSRASESLLRTEFFVVSPGGRVFYWTS